MRTNTCMLVCVCVYMYKHMPTQAHTNIHRHTHSMHTHAHICFSQGMKRRNFSVFFDLWIFIVRLIQIYVKYTPHPQRVYLHLKEK